MYTHQACAQRGALLVERGGLGCSLVEDSVVGHREVDGGPGRGNYGLFAPCGGGHDGGCRRVADVEDDTMMDEKVRERVKSKG